jgi:protein subunit release factor A
MEMITLEQLDQRFETLENKLVKKFDQIDERFDQVDARFEKMDEQFETMEQRIIEKIDEKVDDLAAMTARGFIELRSELKSDIHRVEDRVESIENKLRAKIVFTD